MAAADAVGRKSLFRRGINATRYALAFAVTVLIVMIVVYAFVLVSRPEQLSITVAGGIMFVTRTYPPGAAKVLKPDPQTTLAVTFTLQANNPSGRVRFYYTNIRGRIVLNGTKTFTFFPQGSFPDMDVAPASMLQTDAVATVNYTNQTSPPYFEQLYNDNSSSIVSNAVLKLNGTLTVGLYSVHNKTGAQTVYYCWPLTMGAQGNATMDLADSVPCSTDETILPNNFIV